MYETMPESLWLQLWNDIKMGGTSLNIFMFLCFLLLMKNSIRDFFKEIFNFLSTKLFRQSKNKNMVQYTMKDVINHPIYKQIDFWLEHGIETIHFRGTFQIGNVPQHLIVHTETEEYYLAKEEMAKDLVRLKFQSIKDMQQTFFKEIEFNKMSLELLKRTVEEFFIKTKTIQYNELKEKFPKVFFQKYINLDRMSSEGAFNTIETYFDPKFNFTNATRLYLLLDYMQGYLTNIFNNIATTMSAINGDLNGIEYKGNIIGVSKSTTLPPPHSSFNLIVEKSLKSIKNEFHASRVSLLRFFNTKPNPRNGLLSIVYEVVAPGVTYEKTNLQNYCLSSEYELYKLLLNDTIIASDIGKVGIHTADLLNNRGTKAVVIAPVRHDGELLGALMIDFMSTEAFNKYIADSKNDQIIKDYCSQLNTYIIYPNDFKFPKQ